MGLDAGGPPVAGTVLTWHGCIVNWEALVRTGFESRWVELGDSAGGLSGHAPSLPVRSRDIE